METINLPFNTTKAALNELAEELGVKINVINDVIVIEGDQAEVDEAASRIASLPKAKIDEPAEDPYTSLEKGQRYTDKPSTAYPQSYSVYDLIDFNANTGKWLCRQKTYYFDNYPYQFSYSTYSRQEIDPARLIKMKKVTRRK